MRRGKIVAKAKTKEISKDDLLVYAMRERSQNEQYQKAI